MKRKINRTICLLCLLLILATVPSVAQQDPQYTQYMYMTQVVNPAYVGSREGFNLSALYRTQWVGLDGAPKTLTLAANAPIESSKVGLGLSIVRDEIGPAQETLATIDFSYILDLGNENRLAFGIKAGGNMLDVDYTRLNIADPGDSFEYNIDNRIAPQIGAGVFYFREDFFLGLSVPNMLETEHFDFGGTGEEASSSVARERMHFYLMTGYAFDLTSDLIFRPVLLTKLVQGAPLQVDISSNFLLYDRFVAGVAYRWRGAVSALAGFRLTDSLMLGFAYDFDTTRLRAYNKGSYEFVLRYEIFRRDCCP